MTERQFDDALACCRELFAKKLHDYGAAWRVLRPASLTDQIFIKAQRIRSLQTKGQSQVGEGILPEFIGIVNYGLIGLIQLELPMTESADITAGQALEMYDRKAAMARELMLAKNHD